MASRLVSVQPPDVLDGKGLKAGDEREGVRFARNMCPSQGTMDIFVEPVLPRPQVVVCGSSPVAVADLARRIGFAVTVCVPAVEQSAFDEAERRIEGYALPVEEAGHRFVVVSTQGRGDEAALLSALAVNADYVAFVGSRRKADVLKAALAKRGVAPERLARLKAPGWPRPRRHHARRDRDLDLGGDRRGAAGQAIARQPPNPRTMLSSLTQP